MNKVQKFHDHDPGLVLRIPKDEFAKIIMDFLGSKESLSKKFYSSFCVTMEDIKQFHYLLLEKLEKENSARLNLFNAKIRYSDDSERTLNSFKALEEYYEHRNLFPESISLSWAIILELPKTKSVATQKISLTITKGEDRESNGEIILDIEHTNQSWGFEIYNLFVSQINHISIEDSKEMKCFLFLRNNIFTGFVYKLLLVVCLSSAAWMYNQDLKDKEQAYFAHQNQSIIAIQKFIDEIRLRNDDNELIYILNGLYDLHEKNEISKTDFDKTLNYLNFINRNQIISRNIVKNNKISKLISDAGTNKEELKSKESQLKAIKEKFTLEENLWPLIKIEAILIAKFYFILQIYALFDKYFCFFFTEKPFILITKEEEKARVKYLFKKNKGFVLLIITFTASVIASLIASAIYSLL